MKYLFLYPRPKSRIVAGKRRWIQQAFIRRSSQFGLLEMASLPRKSLSKGHPLVKFKKSADYSSGVVVLVLLLILLGPLVALLYIYFQKRNSRNFYEPRHYYWVYDLYGAGVRFRDFCALTLHMNTTRGWFSMMMKFMFWPAALAWLLSSPIWHFSDPSQFESEYVVLSINALVFVSWFYILSQTFWWLGIFLEQSALKQLLRGLKMKQRGMGERFLNQLADAVLFVAITTAIIIAISICGVVVFGILAALNVLDWLNASNYRPEYFLALLLIVWLAMWTLGRRFVRWRLVVWSRKQRKIFAEGEELLRDMIEATSPERPDDD